jgi:hypothetical protein
VPLAEVKNRLSELREADAEVAAGRTTRMSRQEALAELER